MVEINIKILQRLMKLFDFILKNEYFENWDL